MNAQQALKTLKQHAELRALGHTERFEWWADEFYRETGLMAPGKSLPLEMGGLQEDEARQKAWEAFTAKRSEAFGVALLNAIRAIEALQTINDTYDGCQCEHDTEDCCALVGEECPRCTAARALQPTKEGSSDVPTQRVKR